MNISVPTRILIVGGLGYIGGYLTDYLIEHGYDITVYDNMLFEDRYLKNTKFIYGDIRDSGKLAAVINNFDVVVWLAAIVGDGACAVDVKLTKEINTDTVKWLTDNYSGKIIWASTCSVYGRNDELLTEESPLAPLSAYAESKLEAEKYLLSKRQDALVFRLGTLFGVGDEHSRLRLDLVANILSMKASRGEELSVFGGEQWRPLLHVRDVSTAIAHCLKNSISGLYNLSYGNFKLSEIAEQIVAMIPGATLKYSDLPFEDQRNYRVTNDKILATGWKPTYNLEFGVKQIQSVIQDNRIKNTSDPIYSNAAYIKQIGSF
jgi:nucleoside-diphosphate-sugar epimerase